MKPWRDIPTMEQWRDTLHEYENGELQSYSPKPRGLNKLFSGTWQALEKLTRSMEQYHLEPKDTKKNLTHRAYLLEKVAEKAMAYLNTKPEEKRNWVNDEGKKNFRPKEGSLEREVWSIRQRARRKGEYILGLDRLYNSDKFMDSKLLKPDEMLEYLSTRLPHVDENTLQLGGEVFLEEMDPLHRSIEFRREEDGIHLDPGYGLENSFREWMGSRATAPFFLWLENHPICTAPKGNWRPFFGELGTLDLRQIEYDPKKLEKEQRIWLLHPCKQRLYYLELEAMEGLGGITRVEPQLFDTTRVINGMSKEKKYGGKGVAFIVDLANGIWAGVHKENEIHHSSLSGGKNVKCAGVIRVEEGIVQAVLGDSGHYKPGRSHILKFVQMLKGDGVLGESAEVLFYVPNVDPEKRKVTGTCSDLLSGKI